MTKAETPLAATEPTEEQLDAMVAELFAPRIAEAPAMMAVPAFAAFIGCGVSTTWRHIANGMLPPVVKIGGRTVMPVAAGVRAIAREAFKQRHAAPSRPARGRAA